ncbi:putative bacterial YaeB-like protein [Gregarina niphandrodes]|uniref:Bacterial YaeB-like protein n=1 Tax=Gregarina niphandrodes TaxID=110365 RepID=A0A023B2D4_GRENI|nr:putative bacterial YaeB-like protein [Gregarina niphandrodes]EZG49372.1 putative bacterial YaeB-like protein [Gregarina niphandrodes]|eukprot:XP_011132046.1 putative bacterial YaeB-like protein [Gregarina niphandrodes]
MSIVGYVYDGSFYEKWGTPRQGLCSGEASYASIKLLETLGWVPNRGEAVLVLFLFHLNTSKGAIIGGQNFAKLNSQVTVPKLVEKRAVFATRTPHRPNPIGLSICFVVDVCPGALLVSNVDIVVGTPIVAIYPYQVGYHNLQNAHFPNWLTNVLDNVTPNFDVCVECLSTWTKANHTRNETDVQAKTNTDDQTSNESGSAISETLKLIYQTMKQDARSARSKTVHPNGTFCHTINGNLVVIYRYRGTDAVCILDVVDWNDRDHAIQIFGSADLADRIYQGRTSGRAPEVLDRIKTLPLRCRHNLTP